MQYSFRMTRYLLLVWILAAATGCRKQPSAPVTAVEEEVQASIPNDFFQFYTRFHADSAFQMAHITFPLEGLPTERDSTVAFSDFRWYPEDWVMHHPLNNDDDQFTQEFEIIGDGMIVETIRTKDLPLGMQRRFARLSDGWHLIYYIEMQPMAHPDQ